MRMGHQQAIRLLQSRDCHIASDSWEVIEEFLERIARCQIINQRANGDTSANEDGCATKDFGIAVNYDGNRLHNHTSILDGRRLLVMLGVQKRRLLATFI